MAQDQPPPPSHLFTLRLWAETLGDDRQEVRGKVQHVVSGEARHFRDWTTLEAFLMERLKTPETQPFQPNKSQEEDRGNATGIDDHERAHRPG